MNGSERAIGVLRTDQPEPEVSHVVERVGGSRSCEKRGDCSYIVEKLSKFLSCLYYISWAECRVRLYCWVCRSFRYKGSLVGRIFRDHGRQR